MKRQVQPRSEPGISWQGHQLRGELNMRPGSRGSVVVAEAEGEWPRRKLEPTPAGMGPRLRLGQPLQKLDASPRSSLEESEEAAPSGLRALTRGRHTQGRRRPTPDAEGLDIRHHLDTARSMVWLRRLRCVSRGDDGERGE